MKDLLNSKFGLLTVIADEGIMQKGKRRRHFWKCRCECGNEISVCQDHLVSGDTKSCGCLKHISPNRTHGDSVSDAEYHRLFNIWRHILKRCECETSEAYYNYGGRGITVCEEWHDYMTFKAWALANGYSHDLSIDRINVNGNYEPGNCRWADRIVQANNKRNNRYYEKDGERKTITEWARIYNISPHTVRTRINRDKWNIETALTTPPREA